MTYLIAFLIIRGLDIHFVILGLIILAFCSLIYLACGFFLLKPMESFRVLSVISVTIVTFIIYIYLTFFVEGNAYLLLILGNPSGVAFLSLLGFEFGFIPFIVFPSLIMYFGMMLQDRFRRPEK